MDVVFGEGSTADVRPPSSGPSTCGRRDTNKNRQAIRKIKTTQESLQQIDREIVISADQTQSGGHARRIARTKGWLSKELIEFVARYLGMPPIAA